MGTQPGEALPGPHRSQRALTALARLLASLSRPALRTLCTLRALPLIQGWASAALAVRRWCGSTTSSLVMSALAPALMCFQAAPSKLKAPATMLRSRRGWLELLKGGVPLRSMYRMTPADHRSQAGP